MCFLFYIMAFLFTLNIYIFFWIRKKLRTFAKLLLESGNDLLSRDPAVQVPSAHMSLTSEFGMGSGVASKV